MAASTGCFTGHNYVEPTTPRYGGEGGPPPDGRRGYDTVRVVSFNVERANHPDRALEVLRNDPVARDADLVLLQEMDAPGTRLIAEALGMAWVYYPAILSDTNDRDFGNAILSRWPLVGDRKIILPHLAIFGRTQRIATAATLMVRDVPVEVYSVHLATPINLDEYRRRQQLQAVLDDADVHPRVILGGDFNDGDFGRVAERRGFVWATKEGPRTVIFGRWDYVLTKGLAVTGAGTIEDDRDASDHLPVWAEVIVR